MDELGLSGILITHNGAATVTSVDRKVLHEFSFQIEQIAQIIEYCRERNIQFDLNTPFEMYVEQMSASAKEMYKAFFIEPVMVEDIMQLSTPFVKFTCFGTTEQIDGIMKDWEQLDLGLRIIRSGDFFIDIMQPEVNKGKALKVLADSMHIPAEQIIAIGNYYNDIEMIQFAGLGVAMENSPDAVKEAADFVTLSNNEDGVHFAIQKFLLQQA
jgi:hypothetical protein